MKFQTLVDGLSECINGYVEGMLDPVTERMFKKYLKENGRLSHFVYKSYKGKQALKNTFQVRAADDFEEKLAKRIAEEEEET